MRMLSVIALMLMSCTGLTAQNLYKSDSSMVKFASNTLIASFEASNSLGRSVLNIERKEVIFKIPIAGFGFDIPLMKEHFNENYMDSEKFPYASFKGKFSDSLDLAKDTIYRVKATGVMKMHGLDHAGVYSGTLECKDGVASLSSEFTVQLKDHRIKVPSVVYEEIAQEIAVTVFFRYVATEQK